MTSEGVFGYIRVSTVKQGEKGVSLQEQKSAIEAYASRHNLRILQWFEERHSAAKRGRPVFIEMLRLLSHGRVRGVVIHKIDRSARNLKDWADLGELIDRGVNVYFANESLDLQSRSGRLSADIQAVVAADYIRNLREETRKGFYGRLKQGLYPLPAPLGYSNRGKGQPKAIDPVRGPLIRTAFDLYATARYPLNLLVTEMQSRGLTNRNGNRVTRSGLSTILNNPFYIGFIRLARTGETFAGKHQPLIPKPIFDRVGDVLAGRSAVRATRHNYTFRRLLRCGACGYALVGERQKGRVYYRCHTQKCPNKSVREDFAESSLIRVLDALQLAPAEREYFGMRLEDLTKCWNEDQKARIQGVKLQVRKLRDRLGRLTDAMIDGIIDRGTYEERKRSVLMRKEELEQVLANEPGDNSITDLVAEKLELASRASLSYKTANGDEKRGLLKILTSNSVFTGKTLMFELREPFRTIARRAKSTNGGPYRAGLRTLDSILNSIVQHVSARECFIKDAGTPHARIVLVQDPEIGKCHDSTESSVPRKAA